MPFLRWEAGRIALRAGEHTLGGPLTDAALPTLAALPATAIVEVRATGPALIRRIAAAVMVRVDDEVLGAVPRELAHGARIDIGDLRLTFEHPPGGDEPQRVAAAGAGAATEIGLPALPDAPARLMDLRAGRMFPVTDGGVTIGREPSCDVVLGGKGVSRQHAAISWTAQGFIITDGGSSNGTYVNGERVTTSRALRHGDVLRLHQEELRFEIAGQPAEPTANPHAKTQLFAAGSPLDRLRAVDAAHGGEDDAAPLSARVRGLPLAMLTVTQGALAGATHPVTRPVCAIGREEENDVCLLEESVSKFHATLLLKGETWYVVDLRSANGTLVDGYRIAGERVLPAGAMLTLGNVEMAFQPVTRAGAAAGRTMPLAGLLRRLSKLVRPR